MDKANASGSNSGRKSIIPKPVTPVGHGATAAAALGTKIPAHMTPDDKSKLLSRLDEWRKQKMLLKQDAAGKSKIPSIVPAVVKPKIPAANMTKITDASNVKKEANMAKANDNNNVRKEEKENVFERLFRNATRVSSAKVVEKVELKTDSVKNSRLSMKPKRPSSSSLKRQSNLSNSASKKAPEVETKVIVHSPVPAPAPVEVVEAEPKEIEPSPMEIHEEPIDTLEAPAIFIQSEEVPEPEAFEEIISEPIEVIVMEEEIEKQVDDIATELTEKMEKQIDIAIESPEKIDNDELLEEEPEEKTPIIQNLPVVIVSEPEEIKEEVALTIPLSEEKPDVKPSVKFLSNEKPKKKITFPKIKQIDKNIKKPFLASKSQKPVKVPVQKEEKKPKNPIRRSISMIHRKKTGNVESAIHRAISEQDLSFTEPEIEEPKPREDFEDKASRRRSKSVSFLTPKCKTPTPMNLRDKLETWLHDRGHSISGYRHLKCFGAGALNNSSVFQTPNRSFNDLETSHYATAPNSPNMSLLEDSDKENVTPATAVQRIDIKEVEGWLSDLHRLIVDLKYPHNRCEEWLSAIRRKCIGCTQLPVYWECLAALEQSRGDMNTAIEYYERAIIKGAEVQAVGESLEQLFDKLVIDSNRPTPSKPDKAVDPKNIFKSTIIKFALQQKAVKELGPEIGNTARQQLYIATPVRRSTRLQTPYKPHVVNSLQSIDPELKSSVTFQPNKFLLTEQ